MSTLVAFTDRCYDLFWRKILFAIEAWVLGIWLAGTRVFQSELLDSPRKIDRIEKAAIVLDARNRIVLANQAARRELFQNKLFILGRRICAALPWLEDAIVHTDKEGGPVREVRYMHNGMWRTFEIQITPLRNNRRDLLGKLAVLKEIPQEKRLTEAMVQAQAKTDLLAKVSHELRTPLTSVIGISEMLDYGVYGPLSAEQREAVRLISESTQTMTRLVNDLLDQVHLERGNFVLEETDFLFEDVVNRIRKMARPKATSRGLWLTFEISSEMPAVLHGDPFRLFQILFNLVDNAIKYTSSGTVAVKVYPNNDSFYSVQVSDTGVGIPIEMQKHIFEPFQQIHHPDGNAAAEKGFGLGLSIVKQLVMLLEGEIKLKSEPGKGSTFTVKLPVRLPVEIKH